MLNFTDLYEIWHNRALQKFFSSIPILVRWDKNDSHSTCRSPYVSVCGSSVPY